MLLLLKTLTVTFVLAIVAAIVALIATYPVVVLKMIGGVVMITAWIALLIAVNRAPYTFTLRPPFIRRVTPEDREKWKQQGWRQL
ncbi:MAG: hypothetical protein QNI96_05130 [Woeseiaceae bacterium]|nr:hypothetical protein [Woeseiaceae bacterium]